MVDPREDVPLPSGGFKEPALLDDDEQIGEVPAETGPEPEEPLDDVIDEIDINIEDESEDGTADDRDGNDNGDIEIESDQEGDTSAKQ